MADQFLPSGPTQPSAYPLQAWNEAPAGPPPLPKSPLERPLAAVLRYKWLMLLIIVVAVFAGFAATKLTTPEYEVQAHLMIATETPGEAHTGPIRATNVYTADDYARLLKSYAITDEVVRKLALYVSPNNPKDRPLFQGFGLENSRASGSFQLTLNVDRRRWVLVAQPSGVAVDSGGAADSVGRQLGFRWQLPESAFAGAGQKEVKFSVGSPRQTSADLIARLQAPRAIQTNFMELTLRDRDPQMAAVTLNTWLRQFMDVAGELKKSKLTVSANELERQLTSAKMSLDSAEFALQSLRVHTITLPSENVAITAGVSDTRDPVIRRFFEKQTEYDDLRRDSQMLRALIANVARDSLPSEALLQIRSVSTGQPVARALLAAVTQYQDARQSLAQKRQTLQDAHPDVQALIAQVNDLRTQKIPQYAGELLQSLRVREYDDSVQIENDRKNLQQIPQRTADEEQLRRRRENAANFYTDLQTRYATAKLAEAGATPDVRVLDTAIAPLVPSRNTAPRLMLMAIVGGVGAAFALALLLDRLDGRLRYPEQASEELGLPIAGTVPRFPKRGVSQDSPEQMFQLIESFRTMRMSVANAHEPGPIAIAVSSPAPSEGKSLISANLAMSFADAGLRTVLVDGDTRRGSLNEMFEVQSSPGLTDYLVGGPGLNEVIRETSHEALSIIPSGTRRRRSPELLMSQKLVNLINQLRGMYDVVIVDTPPLAAGVDGYSIATATGSLLLVLRVGQTLRRLTSEKLRMFERLPVNIVGAVLNGISRQGQYGYYSYVSGYEVHDEGEPETLEIARVR